VIDHPHAKLAREAWEAVSHGDRATLERVCSADLVWHASGRGERAGEYRGLEVVLEYLAAIGDGAQRFDSSFEDVLVGEGLVAVLFRVSGSRDDRVLDTGFILLFRFGGERITEVWSIARDQHAVDEFWA
jgi:ketosteroid isomerase-like protein